MIELLWLLAQQQPPSRQCHPNYSECLPIFDDWECGYVKARNFQVLGGEDPYRLDVDGTGIACKNEPLPTKIGTCTHTLVREVSYRLGSYDDNNVFIPEPNTGSAITFENNGYQVSYDHVPAIHESRSGDPVRVCLTFIPDCSDARAGDDRGKTYLTTNLRTYNSWELRDSPHMCGGA
jgi:hypothetical protein